MLRIPVEARNLSSLLHVQTIREAYTNSFRGLWVPISRE